MMQRESDWIGTGAVAQFQERVRCMNMRRVHHKPALAAETDCNRPTPPTPSFPVEQETGPGGGGGEADGVF